MLSIRPLKYLLDRLAPPDTQDGREGSGSYEIEGDILRRVGDCGRCRSGGGDAGMGRVRQSGTRQPGSYTEDMEPAIHPTAIMDRGNTSTANATERES